MRKAFRFACWCSCIVGLAAMTAVPAWCENPATPAPAAAAVVTPEPTATPAPTPVVIPAPVSAAAPALPPIQFYGFVRLDAAFDTARMVPGNYALYVKSAADNRGDDNQLSLTANQSRLGLNLSAPEVGGVKPSGKIEFDFYGGGVENKSNPMMRHAYAEIAVPAWDLGVLVGQTWDVLSPLAPETVNFLACAMAGEIAYRRPQVRLTKNFGLGGDAKLTFKASVSRTLGDALSNTYTVTFKDGADPTYQASVAYSVPLLTKQPATIGLSGALGREVYDTTVGRSYDTYGLYALSAELSLPLADGFVLKGSVWKGTNLDTYLGGIGQGILTAGKQTLNSQGGWASLSIGPFGALRGGLGGGIDAPQFDQLAAGSRFQNSTGYVNVFYALTPVLTLSGEVSYWQTLYRESQAGKAMRYQTAIIYAF